MTAEQAAELIEIVQTCSAVLCFAAGAWTTCMIAIAVGVLRIAWPRAN